MSETPSSQPEAPTPLELTVTDALKAQMAALATEGINDISIRTLERGTEHAVVGYWASDGSSFIDAEFSEPIEGTPHSVKASLAALSVPGHPAIVVHTHPPGSIDRLSLPDLENAQSFWEKGSRSTLNQGTDLLGDMPVIVVACPESTGTEIDELSIAVLVVSQVPGKRINFDYFLDRMNKQLIPSDQPQALLLAALDNRPTEIGNTGLCMHRTTINPIVSDSIDDLQDYLKAALPGSYKTKSVNLQPPKNLLDQLGL